jgi:Tfp pilus assembly protein PilO
MQAIDKKQLMLSVILVLALALWYVGLFRKVQSNTSNLQSRMVVLNEEIKKNVPEANILKIRQQADSLGLALQERAKRILREDEFQNLGKRIEQSMAGYGLKVSAVKPDYENLKAVSAEKTSDSISEWLLGLELKGSFSEFTKLVDALPKMPFALKLDQFLLVKDEDPKTSLQITLKGAAVFSQADTSQKQAKTGEKK